MPLTLIVEDGTGLADANSYASLEEADAYHEASLYATAWTAATEDNRNKALAMATILRMRPLTTLPSTRALSPKRNSRRSRLEVAPNPRIPWPQSSWRRPEVADPSTRIP